MSKNTVAGLTSAPARERRPAGSRRRFVTAALLVALVSSGGVAACSPNDSTTPGGSATVPGHDRQDGQHDDTIDTLDGAHGGVEPIDPDELRPILTMTALPNDSIRWVGGVPDIAVYANGQVVVWDVSDELEVQVRAGMIDSEIVRLVGIAESGGLTGGGFEQLEPPPQEVGTEDGGVRFFGARAADGVWTTRVVPNLGGYAPDVLPASLAGLAELRDALQEMAPRATDEVDISRWVVVGLSGTPLERVGWDWLDEARETLDLLPELDDPDTSWTRFEADAGSDPVKGRPLAGGLCMVINQPTWTTAPGSLDQMPFELDGRLHKLVVRPLMPHENDCNDVARTMVELPLS